MRIAIALVLACACWAQAEFEVASVKPNTSMDGGMSINRSPGGVFTATNVTLKMLVTFAYDIRPHQLSGGAGWMDSDRWDIVARPSAEDAAAEPTTYSFNSGALDRLHQRVQALLADRFKLVVHTETKEMPILALVVAKGGPHLAEAKSSGPSIQGRMGELTCKKVSMKMFAEGRWRSAWAATWWTGRDWRATSISRSSTWKTAGPALPRTSPGRTS